MYLFVDTRSHGGNAVFPFITHAEEILDDNAELGNNFVDAYPFDERNPAHVEVFISLDAPPAERLEIEQVVAIFQRRLPPLRDTLMCLIISGALVGMIMVSKDILFR